MDKGATLVTAALPSAFFFEVIDEIWSKAISSLTTHTRTPLCGREPLSGTHTTHTHTHTETQQIRAPAPVRQPGWGHPGQGRLGSERFSIPLLLSLLLSQLITLQGVLTRTAPPPPQKKGHAHVQRDERISSPRSGKMIPPSLDLLRRCVFVCVISLSLYICFHTGVSCERMVCRVSCVCVCVSLSLCFHTGFFHVQG